MTIHNILLKLSPHKLQLADALRSIIRASHSSIEEKMKYGRITFSTPTADIAFLCCKKENDHIELGFFKAVLLNDQSRLFEGKGKEIRRIKVHSLEKIPVEQIEAWVKEAVALTNN